MAAAGIRFGLSLALIWGSHSALQQSPYPAGRRACASERLDDDHTAAAAWAWIRVGRIGLAGVIGSLGWIGLLGRREQLAHPGDVMRAGAAGQQAVVANAMEAARQDVNEKAADELGDRKRHCLLAIAPLEPIVFPFERDGAVSERDPPAVGDGDAMDVARQIGQNGLGLNRSRGWGKRPFV